MLRRTVGWVAFWTGAGVLFWRGDVRGWSLCSSVRWLFRTDTPVGRAAFNAVYVTGAEVLRQHILNPPD